MKIAPFMKTYEGVPVLDFPGLELQPGNIYSVIGANGSGKSTFARVLAGVLPADKKSPCLEGSISVGYLPQRPYAFRMSVRSNILLGGSDQARTDGLMDAVLIRHLAAKRADRLSGGETARMALVRLMMQRFDLVILDEPTAAMDVETTALTEALIREYVEETGCALILISHSLQQARRMADEALFFYRGKLLESGPAETVLHTPDQPETRKFLEFYGI